MTVTTSTSRVRPNQLFTVTVTKHNIDLLSRLQNYIQTVLIREIAVQGRALTAHIQQRYLSGPRSELTLDKRSGKIRKNTKPLPVTVINSSIVGGTVIGEDVPYTRVHVGPIGQTTIIRPRSAGALAIPIEGGPAMNPSGTLKTLFSSAGGLRNVPNLFRGRAANNLRPDVLYLRMSGNRVLPAFVLRNQVTIRTKVFPEVIAFDQAPVVKEALEQAVQDMLRGRFS